MKDPPDAVDKKLSVSDNEVDEKEESLNKEENMDESTDTTSHEGNLHHNMAHSQMTILLSSSFEMLSIAFAYFEFQMKHVNRLSRKGTMTLGKTMT